MHVTLIFTLILNYVENSMPPGRATKLCYNSSSKCLLEIVQKRSIFF